MTSFIGPGIILPSLQVVPGEPGIDTNAAGALLLGDNNATSIEVGAGISDTTTTHLTKTQGGWGLSNTGGDLVMQTSNGGTFLNFQPGGANRWRMDSGGHLLSVQAGALVSSNLGANVTSVTPAGNDVRGLLTIIMAGALAANTRIATLTYANAYGAAPGLVLLVNETSAAGIVIVNFYSGAEAAGAFDLFSDQALAAGTYVVKYLVIG